MMVSDVPEKQKIHMQLNFELLVYLDLQQL